MLEGIAISLVTVMLIPFLNYRSLIIADYLTLTASETPVSLIFRFEISLKLESFYILLSVIDCFLHFPSSYCIFLAKDLTFVNIKWRCVWGTKNGSIFGFKLVQNSGTMQDRDCSGSCLHGKYSTLSQGLFTCFLISILHEPTAI